MKRYKLTFMLALAVLPLLVWGIAMSGTSNPLISAYGVFGCLFQAIVISLFSSYLVVRVIEEI